MIEQIYIKNFRSIKEMTLDVNSLNALVGPNSTGKTNVLKALDLVLGEGWTTKAKVARELFNDPVLPIIIEVRFKQAIVIPDNFGGSKLINKVCLKMTLEPELSVKTTINNNETFYGQEQFKRHCHFIYIPSERNLNSELRVSNWTMLGKMMKAIHENYVEYCDNDDKLRQKFECVIKPAKDFLEADFSDKELTFHKFSAAFKKHCKRNSSGLANDFEPALNIYNLNWFYKTLQIQVKEDYPERHFDSEEVGAGMQNLILISIFQTYAELMGQKVIFGIEEPEIYLYPQAQRSLFKSFVELSKNTQIFYTTHNPNFVDAGRPDDIILLRKECRSGTYQLKKSDLFNSSIANKCYDKIFTHFNNERNELFFANKILLVEGVSDKMLFQTLCEEKWDIDLDEKGISIIECGGKAGVIYFLGLCKLIGQDNCIAVWDKDEDVNDSHGLLAAALENVKGIELNPNLEKYLGLPSGKDVAKVKNAYNYAVNCIVDKIPKELLSVKKFLTDDVVQGDVFDDNDLPF